MGKTYVISEGRLVDLVSDQLALNALERGGVDNWEWYGENTDEFIASFEIENVEDFVDLAEALIPGEFKEYIK